jgi:hypothetical protein
VPDAGVGPGSINQAHQPDEYLETRFIKPTRELITRWFITSAGINDLPLSKRGKSRSSHFISNAYQAKRIKFRKLPPFIRLLNRFRSN